MHKPKKLVIFDMDGTLIDSSATISNAINYVRSNLGLEPMDHERIISKVNDHSIDPAKFFYDIDRLEPIHEKLFSEYYSANHYKELRLYEGAKELLQWLRKKSILTALATNAYHNSTVESLRHFGIEDLFDDVVCADDVEEGKPSPVMLYRILKDLNVGTEEALFVGDGPRDRDAAVAAGIDYLMVDWGFTDHGNDTEVIRSMDELKQKLKELT